MSYFFPSFKNTGAGVRIVSRDFRILCFVCSLASLILLIWFLHSSSSVVVVVVVLVRIVSFVRLALVSRWEPLMWQLRLLVGPGASSSSSYSTWWQWRLRRQWNRRRQTGCRLGCVAAAVAAACCNLLIQRSPWWQIFLSPLDTRIFHVHHVVFIPNVPHMVQLVQRFRLDVVLHQQHVLVVNHVVGGHAQLFQPHLLRPLGDAVLGPVQVPMLVED